MPHVIYDPLTGVFTRHCPDAKPHIKARFHGKETGCVAGHGYVIIGIGSKTHYAHRLAWEISNGPIPEGMMVDHINRVRTDNRLVNLRLVTAQGNSHNSTAGGKSKYLGVYPARSKWRAGIQRKDLRWTSTLFDTDYEAHLIRELMLELGKM